MNMGADAMQHVTPEMIEFVRRYKLPESVLADFDRMFEERKSRGANAWRTFVAFANRYESASTAG
jgi:hypothetical protein